MLSARRQISLFLALLSVLLLGCHRNQTLITEQYFEPAKTEAITQTMPVRTAETAPMVTARYNSREETLRPLPAKRSSLSTASLAETTKMATQTGETICLTESSKTKLAPEKEKTTTTATKATTQQQETKEKPEETKVTVETACTSQETSATTTEPVSTTAKTTTETTAVNHGAADLRQAMFDATNCARSANGIAPLKPGSSALNKAANARAKEVAEKFAHERPDGTGFHTVLKEYGIDRFSCAGENIANYSQSSSTDVVLTAWLNSQGHRTNIMNPSYTQLAIGLYQSPQGRNYWVQLFYN